MRRRQASGAGKTCRRNSCGSSATVNSGDFLAAVNVLDRRARAEVHSPDSMDRCDAGWQGDSIFVCGNQGRKQDGRAPLPGEEKYSGARSSRLRIAVKEKLYIVPPGGAPRKN